MKAPTYARAAAKLLMDAESAPAEVQNRSASITLLDEALAKRRQRLRRRRIYQGAMGALATAAAALVAIRFIPHEPATSTVSARANDGAITVVAHPTGTAALIGSGNSGTSIGDGTSIKAGSLVRSGGDGRVALALSTGTTLSIEHDSVLEVVSTGRTETFRLESGTIRADVAKLAVNERFLIETPDSEVEVHGTSFNVSVVPENASCGDRSTSRVTVFEGVVTVRHAGAELQLHAGDVFNPGCSPPATVASAPVLELPATRADVRLNTPLPTAQTKLVAPKGETERASGLAEQNRIFSDALGAKRRGSNAAAIAGFDQLLATYPRGPLAESATVERMRLLRSVDPQRAATAARNYLADFPFGFARRDAESILAEHP